MKNRQGSSNIGFVDMAMNLMLLFFILFTLALLTPNTTTPMAIDPKSAYVIDMEWDEGLNVDIDLHVLGPDGSKAYYASKETGYMHLERDDLGFSNDTIMVDGETIINPTNLELLFLRNPIEGLYVVNIYYYSKRTYNGPVNIKLRLISVKNYSIIAEKNIVLQAIDVYTQKTAFSFVVNNYDQIDLIDFETQYPFIIGNKP